MSKTTARTKINVGRNLANTSRGQGTFGITDEDKLKAGRESARLLLEGTMQKNREKRDRSVNNKRNR